MMDKVMVIKEVSGEGEDKMGEVVVRIGEWESKMGGEMREGEKDGSKWMKMDKNSREEGG